MSSVLLLLHVVTAVFIVGPMAILPMTGLRALRSGNARQVRTLAKSTAIFSWLSLITFLLGFGVAGMWKLSITTPWLLWSIILYAIAFLLTVFLVVPRMQAAANQAEGSTEEAKPAGYGLIAATSGICSLLLVAVVVLMSLPH